jgi:hypothetical protein
MVRGLERRKIFLSEADRKDLLRRFSEVLPKTGARLYAWSFLTNTRICLSALELWAYPRL